MERGQEGVRGVGRATATSLLPSMQRWQLRFTKCMILSQSKGRHLSRLRHDDGINSEPKRTVATWWRTSGRRCALMRCTPEISNHPLAPYGAPTISGEREKNPIPFETVSKPSQFADLHSAPTPTAPEAFSVAYSMHLLCVSPSNIGYQDEKRHPTTWSTYGEEAN
jgi:hypothetical protein